MKHSLKIESPCHADWGAMAGDARKRHCGECRLDVFNFSEMTQREVDRVLEHAKKRAAKHSDARLCVRYVQREDGSIVTKQCATGFRANLLRAVRWTSAMVAALISFVPAMPLAARGALLGTAVVQTTGREASPVALVQIQAAAKANVIEVVDPSGAYAPNATVMLVSEKSTASTTLHTDKNGAAKLDELPEGIYRVEVVSLGFVTERRKSISLPLRTALRVELRVASTMGAVVVVPTEPVEPTNMLPRKQEEPRQSPAKNSVVQVLGQNGMPMGFVQIRLVNNKTGDAVWFATDKRGVARVHGVASGEYRIEFEQGRALEDVSRVTFPAATAVRVTYQYGLPADTMMGAIGVGPATDPKTGKPVAAVIPANQMVREALRDEENPQSASRLPPGERPTTDQVNEAGPRDSVVQVMSPDGYPMGFLQITLVNNATGDAYFFETDTHGIAHVQSIPDGSYRIGLYEGEANENLSEVQFPWATPLRATYRLVARGGPAWLTEFPELDVQPQRLETTHQETNSAAAAAPRRSFEEPVPPEIDPNAELETPLGMASLALHVNGPGLKPGTETVTVVVTNDETHAEATGTPDARGEIRFVGLPEGMYTIAVSAPQRGTTTLHQKLPSMLPVHAFLSFRVDPDAEPMMGAVAFTKAKTKKK